MESGTYTTSAVQAEPAAVALSMVILAIYFAVIVLILVAMWRLFAKAGRPGWQALIPFYNAWVLAEIVGRPGWVGLLNFVPIVQIYTAIILNLDLAKSFGKSVTFGVLTIFFPIIMIPLLAFGDAKYAGPAAQGKVLEP